MAARVTLGGESEESIIHRLQNMQVVGSNLALNQWQTSLYPRRRTNHDQNSKFYCEILTSSIKEMVIIFIFAKSLLH